MSNILEYLFFTFDLQFWRTSGLRQKTRAGQKIPFMKLKLKLRLQKSCSCVTDAFVLIIAAHFDKYCFSVNLLIGNFSLACRILNKQIISVE